MMGLLSADKCPDHTVSSSPRASLKGQPCDVPWQFADPNNPLSNPPSGDKTNKRSLWDQPESSIPPRSKPLSSKLMHSTTYAPNANPQHIPNIQSSPEMATASNIPACVTSLVKSCTANSLSAACTTNTLGMSSMPSRARPFKPPRMVNPGLCQNRGPAGSDALLDTIRPRPAVPRIQDNAASGLSSRYPATVNPAGLPSPRLPGPVIQPSRACTLQGLSFPSDCCGPSDSSPPACRRVSIATQFPSTSAYVDSLVAALVEEINLNIAEAARPFLSSLQFCTLQLLQRDGRGTQTKDPQQHKYGGNTKVMWCAPRATGGFPLSGAHELERVCTQHRVPYFSSCELSTWRRASNKAASTSAGRKKAAKKRYRRGRGAEDIDEIEEEEEEPPAEEGPATRHFLTVSGIRGKLANTCRCVVSPCC